MKKFFSKVLILFIITLNVVFTITILYIFWKTGFEPSTLIVSWFGFTTGELWLLASIKKKEVTEETMKTIYKEGTECEYSEKQK